MFVCDHFWEFNWPPPYIDSLTPIRDGQDRDLRQISGRILRCPWKSLSSTRHGPVNPTDIQIHCSCKVTVQTEKERNCFMLSHTRVTTNCHQLRVQVVGLVGGGSLSLVGCCGLQTFARTPAFSFNKCCGCRFYQRAICKYSFRQLDIGDGKCWSVGWVDMRGGVDGGQRGLMVGSCGLLWSIGSGGTGWTVDLSDPSRSFIYKHW